MADQIGHLFLRRFPVGAGNDGRFWFGFWYRLKFWLWFGYRLWLGAGNDCRFHCR